MLGGTYFADQHSTTEVKAEAILAPAQNRAKARRALFRPILDAAGTFALLCLICLSMGAGPTAASPNVPSVTTYQAALSPGAMKAIGESDVRPVVEIATTSSPSNADAVYHRTSAQAAWALLMIGFSIVAALNMALFRHLRQAYASPRRRGAQN
jgi:hypothetical protein